VSTPNYSFPKPLNGFWVNVVLKGPTKLFLGEFNFRSYCYNIIFYFTWNMMSNYMEQSPSWEADSGSASKETFRLLWNVKVHYRDHKWQPMVHILSHIHPVLTSSPYFPKLHSNIIFPSTSRSSMSSLPFRFSNQNFVYIIISAMRATFTAHHKLWSSSLCSFLNLCSIFFFLGPNVPPRNLSSNTFNPLVFV